MVGKEKWGMYQTSKADDDPSQFTEEKRARGRPRKAPSSLTDAQKRENRKAELRGNPLPHK